MDAVLAAEIGARPPFTCRKLEGEDAQGVVVGRFAFNLNDMRI
jgi:hypothetical protein